MQLSILSATETPKTEAVPKTISERLKVCIGHESRTFTKPLFTLQHALSRADQHWLNAHMKLGVVVAEKILMQFHEIKMILLRAHWLKHTISIENNWTKEIRARQQSADPHASSKRQRDRF